MKQTLYLATMLILFAFSVGLAQHTIIPVRMATFQGDLRDFSEASGNLFAVGYNLGIKSFVVKSTNNGISWTELTSPFAAGDNLTTIAFPTPQLGLVAGSGGVIWRTTDGGTTWNTVSAAGYTGGINDLVMLNATTGYACGSSNNNFNVLKTTDGGATWTGINTGNTNTMYSMAWLNTNECVIVGASGRFLKTTNGGTSWTAGTVTGSTSAFYAVTAVSPTTLYATGTLGAFAKSTDAGATFSFVGQIVSGAMYTLHFTDANNGVVLGTNGLGYRTTNAGTSWTEINTMTSEVIRTSFKSATRLFAGAYRSTLLYSDDNGLTWIPASNSSRDMYGIRLDQDQNIVIAGDRGEINISSNYGTTWNKTSFVTGNILYDALKFGSTMYTCGRNGGFFVSTNNGATWTDRTQGSASTRFYKMQFHTLATGFMVSNEGTVLFTTNGGTNWSTQVTLLNTTLYDINMISPTLGYACGSGERIFKTTDGITWSHGTMVSPSGQLTGIYMLDELRGFVCGERGAVYKTTDGFQSIQLLTDTIALQQNLIHDVVAFDMNNVWAVGTGGLLLRSSSQSQMVPVQNTGITEDLLALTKSGPQHLLASGTDGKVYAVRDGIIPVELVSFTALPDGKSIVLEWNTATELNNQGFTVLYQRDGNSNWQEAGFVPGSGTTTTPQRYHFTIPDLASGSYRVTLRQTDFDGTSRLLNEVLVSLMPSQFLLHQNYPNPFNPSTAISFSIPVKSEVTLRVYDLLGNSVATLAQGVREAGSHTVNFNAAANGNPLAAGVYFYTLRAGDFSSTKKMILLP